jgi:hypothetical protein
MLTKWLNKINDKPPIGLPVSKNWNSTITSHPWSKHQSRLSIYLVMISTNTERRKINRIWSAKAIVSVCRKDSIWILIIWKACLPMKWAISMNWIGYWCRARSLQLILISFKIAISIKQLIGRNWTTSTDWTRDWWDQLI